MIRIAALNESSSDEDGPEDFSVGFTTKEAQEAEAFSIYNKGLSLQRQGDTAAAEDAFRSLLDFNLVKDAPTNVEDEKQNLLHPGLLLKYSVRKNLASIAIQRREYKEAMVSLLEAVNVDSSDVTLWHKIGTTAVKLDNYQLAKCAFVQGLACNPNHWPCIDHAITILYALNNFTDCLYYIGQALERDPGYMKGLAFKDQIFSEQFSLKKECSEYFKNCDQSAIDDSIAPEEKEKFVTEAVNIRKRRRELWKQPEPAPLTFVEPLKSFTWKNLGECLIALYDYCSGKSYPQSVCSRVDLTMYETINPDQPIPLTSVPLAVPMDCTPSETGSTPVITPMSSVTNTPVLAQTPASQLLAYTPDESSAPVTMDVDDISKPRSKKRGSKRKRLAEELDPFIHKRRSARVRDTGKKKQEESVDYQVLLREFLPSSLKAYQEDPDETATKANEQTALTIDLVDGEKIELLQEYDPDAWAVDEAKVVHQFLKDHIINCGVSHIMKKYLLKLAGKIHEIWPPEMPEIYVKIYSRVRKHITLPCYWFKEVPDDVIKNTATMTLLWAEYKIDQWLQTRAKAGTSPSSTRKSPAMSNIRLGPEFPGEFFNADVRYLMGLLSHADILEEFWQEYSIRVVWLKAHYFILNCETELAAGAFDEITSFLSDIQKETSVHFTIKLRNCKSETIISMETVQKQIDSLHRCQSLEELQRLYEQEKYQNVVNLLLPTFKSGAPKGKTVIEANRAIPERHAQLLLLQDSLLKLNNPELCLLWGEESINEALQCYLSVQTTEAKEEWISTMTQLFEGVEKSLSKNSSIIGTLHSKNLVRFSHNLIRVIELAMDIPESSTEMIGTVLPWILLYRLIEHEETKFRRLKEADGDFTHDWDTDMPSSLMLLNIAHEYLGRRSWCTNSDGALLMLFVDVVAAELKKYGHGSSHPLQEDLEQALEQCLYCLYSYPNKKAKVRHLQDHNADQVTLTWNRSILLFDYYKPKTVPEFDSYKTSTVSADLEFLLRRICTLVPPQPSPLVTIDMLTSYVDGATNIPPTLPEGHVIEGQSHVVLEMYYLLADYYFKNKEQAKAIKFYLHDLCVTPERFDSWAGMALARSSRLEQKLSSNELKSEGQIHKHAALVLRCFRRALDLDDSNSKLWIEYGSFAYQLHMYASRQLKQQFVFPLTTENRKIAQNSRDEMLKTAENCYLKAGECGDPDEIEERWLHHYMLGKIGEKMKRDPKEFLDHYKQAAYYLYQDNARFPKKIHYIVSPPHLAVEALEIHYRRHVSIVKYLLRNSKGITRAIYETFMESIKEAADSPFAIGREKRHQKKESHGDRLSTTFDESSSSNLTAPTPITPPKGGKPTYHKTPIDHDYSKMKSMDSSCDSLDNLFSSPRAEGSSSEVESTEGALEVSRNTSGRVSSEEEGRMELSQRTSEVSCEIEELNPEVIESESMDIDVNFEDETPSLCSTDAIIQEVVREILEDMLDKVSELLNLSVEGMTTKESLDFFQEYPVWASSPLHSLTSAEDSRGSSVSAATNEKNLDPKRADVDEEANTVINEILDELLDAVVQNTDDARPLSKTEESTTGCCDGHISISSGTTPMEFSVSTPGISQTPSVISISTPEESMETNDTVESVFEKEEEGLTELSAEERKSMEDTVGIQVEVSAKEGHSGAKFATTKDHNGEENLQDDFKEAFDSVQMEESLEERNREKEDPKGVGHRQSDLKEADESIQMLEGSEDVEKEENVGVGKVQSDLKEVGDFVQIGDISKDVENKDHNRESVRKLCSKDVDDVQIKKDLVEEGGVVQSAKVVEKADEISKVDEAGGNVERVKDLGNEPLIKENTDEKDRKVDLIKQETQPFDISIDEKDELVLGDGVMLECVVEKQTLDVVESGQNGSGDTFKQMPRKVTTGLTEKGDTGLEDIIDTTAEYPLGVTPIGDLVPEEKQTEVLSALKRESTALSVSPKTETVGASEERPLSTGDEKQESSTVGLVNEVPEVDESLHSEGKVGSRVQSPGNSKVECQEDNVSNTKSPESEGHCDEQVTEEYRQTSKGLTLEGEGSRGASVEQHSPMAQEDSIGTGGRCSPAREQQTSSPAEEQMVQKQTVERQIAPEQTVKNEIPQDLMSVKQLAQDKIAEKQVTQDKTAEKQVAQRQTTEKQVAEELVAQGKTTDKQLAQDKTAEKQMVQEQATDKHVAQEQTTDKQVVQEQTTEDQIAQEQTAEDQIAQEKTTEKQVAEEQTTEDKSPKEQTAEDQMAQEQAAREKQISVLTGGLKGREDSSDSQRRRRSPAEDAYESLSKLEDVVQQMLEKCQSEEYRKDIFRIPDEDGAIKSEEGITVSKDGDSVGNLDELDDFDKIDKCLEAARNLASRSEKDMDDEEMLEEDSDRVEVKQEVSEDVKPKLEADVKPSLRADDNLEVTSDAKPEVVTIGDKQTLIDPITGLLEVRQDLEDEDLMDIDVVNVEDETDVKVKMETQSPDSVAMETETVGSAGKVEVVSASGDVAKRVSVEGGVSNQGGVIEGNSEVKLGMDHQSDTKKLTKVDSDTKDYAMKPKEAEIQTDGKDLSESKETSTAEDTDKDAPAEEVSPEFNKELLDECIKALHLCLNRFPTHYKSMYQLAKIYYRSKWHKNLTWAQDYLLGSPNWSSMPHMSSQGLFQERKQTNMFNGIWRLPIEEIDRSGSFATHVYRSVALLLDVMKDCGDINILLYAHTQLGKTPEGTKKYMRDPERIALSKKAFKYSQFVIRKRMRTNSRETNPEILHNLLYDIYKVWMAGIKLEAGSDEYNSLLVDGFKLCKPDQIESSAPVLDQAIAYCSHNLSMKIQTPSHSDAKKSTSTTDAPGSPKWRTITEEDQEKITKLDQQSGKPNQEEKLPILNKLINETKPIKPISPGPGMILPFSKLTQLKQNIPKNAPSLMKPSTMQAIRESSNQPRSPVKDSPSRVMGMNLVRPCTVRLVKSPELNSRAVSSPPNIAPIDLTTLKSTPDSARRSPSANKVTTVPFINLAKSTAASSTTGTTGGKPQSYKTSLLQSQGVHKTLKLMKPKVARPKPYSPGMIIRPSGPSSTKTSYIVKTVGTQKKVVSLEPIYTQKAPSSAASSTATVRASTPPIRPSASATSFKPSATTHTLKVPASETLKYKVYTQDASGRTTVTTKTIMKGPSSRMADANSGKKGGQLTSSRPSMPGQSGTVLKGQSTSAQPMVIEISDDSD